MDTPPIIPLADHFARLNGRRRAVRRFNDQPISDAALLEIGRQAQLAPSSRNGQPYRLLCVRSAELKAAIAPLCNDQAAARTAAALVVVVTGRALALETLNAWEQHLAGDSGLDMPSIAYHRAELKNSRAFLRIGAWPIWSPLLGMLALLQPSASLLPVGRLGIRHWTARGALYAAQTFMLAAAAHDLDTCPMEGFNASKLARALRLPRDFMIPLIIAVGHSSADARCEPRWRKPLQTAVELL